VTQQQYDPEPFRQLLVELLKKTGESYRKASLAAGLPSNAISKYMSGLRPSQRACVALADHFGVNPNELLQAAGYEPLRIFDRSLMQSGEMSPEMQEVFAQIQQIEDPIVRRRMLEAIATLIDAYLRAAKPKAAEAVEPKPTPSSVTSS